MTTPLLVKVLGSGTCVPLAERFPSSYFVRTEQSTSGWLLDLGAGTLQRLAQAGESYQDLDKIFISHAHPDHSASLIPLLQALNYTPGFQRVQPLTIFAPRTVKDFLDLNLDFAPSLRPAYPFEFIVLNDRDEVLRDGWRLDVRAMKHSTPTLAARLTMEGCCLVYGADTEPCEALIELAHNADLLILEASFRQNHPSPGHMTTLQAGGLARAANVGRLLISHFFPEVSDMSVNQREAEVRASGFTGDVLFAEDLTVIEVISHR